MCNALSITVEIKKGALENDDARKNFYIPGQWTFRKFT